MSLYHVKPAIRIIATVVACFASVSAAETDQKPSLDVVVKGNTKFAIKMHQQLGKEDGNIFFSPYSISTALGMTYAGARGNTEKEMKEALHFPGAHDAIGSAFGELQNKLNSVQKAGNVKLNIANAIWAEKNYSFLPSYMELVEKDYGSKISRADFITNAEGERKVINTWVESKTNKKIKDLIPPSALGPSTRMVLVNAIYFKGDWARQFNEKLTRKVNFYVTPDKKVKANMMHQVGEFRLATDADTKVLEMPYKGKNLSMLVLLPKKKDGISKLEKTLTHERLDSLIAKLKTVEVEVAFPKFKLETDAYNLIPPFKNLGMRDAFSNADFSGMDGTNMLLISDILHKAFVAVDEKGTEAAAATAVKVLERAMLHRQFNANHPFLFLIRDNTTDSILFMGRMSDPS